MKCKLYFDEDNAEEALVKALRGRGVDVCVPSQVGLLEADDLTQLRWCAQQQRVLVTCNIGDYYGLHSDFLAGNESHAGIIAIQQQTLSMGERMRRLIKLCSILAAEQMKNRIEFLSHW